MVPHVATIFATRSLDLTGPLLLGGVPDLPESFPVRTRHFVGCMRNLQVDSRHVDMADFIANNGTVPGMRAWGRGQARSPGQKGGLCPVWGRVGGFRGPSSSRFSVWSPEPSLFLSLLGCPAKKNVCDSSTCNNGGTCVNQWDAFSCECPLGFGGKSCAQGRRGSHQRPRPESCHQCWEHWQGPGRHWAGPSQAGLWVEKRVWAEPREGSTGDKGPSQRQAWAQCGAGPGQVSALEGGANEGSGH